MKQLPVPQQTASLFGEILICSACRQPIDTTEQPPEGEEGKVLYTQVKTGKSLLNFCAECRSKTVDADTLVSSDLTPRKKKTARKRKEKS